MSPASGSASLRKQIQRDHRDCRASDFVEHQLQDFPEAAPFRIKSNYFEFTTEFPSPDFKLLRAEGPQHPLSCLIIFITNNIPFSSLKFSLTPSGTPHTLRNFIEEPVSPFCLCGGPISLPIFPWKSFNIGSFQAQKQTPAFHRALSHLSMSWICRQEMQQSGKASPAATWFFQGNCADTGI